MSGQAAPTPDDIVAAAAIVKARLLTAIQVCDDLDLGIPFSVSVVEVARWVDDVAMGRALARSYVEFEHKEERRAILFNLMMSREGASSAQSWFANGGQRMSLEEIDVEIERLGPKSPKLSPVP